MGDFFEHVLFGFLAGVTVLYLVNDLLYATRVEMVAASLMVFLGSIIPDIDHENSYVYRSVKSFASLVAGMLAFLLAPGRVWVRFSVAASLFLAVYSLLSALRVSHRGFTHSLSFCAISASTVTVAGVLVMGSSLPGVAAGIGIGSHLVLDRELKL